MLSQQINMVVLMINFVIFVPFMFYGLNQMNIVTALNNPAFKQIDIQLSKCFSALQGDLTSYRI